MGNWSWGIGHDEGWELGESILRFHPVVFPISLKLITNYQLP